MLKQLGLKTLADLFKKQVSPAAGPYEIVSSTGSPNPTVVPMEPAEAIVEPPEPAGPEGASGLWMLHPAGRYLLDRGGFAVPPPIVANIALTNKCNLRCEICGSQKNLDKTGGRRRHTHFEQLQSIAEALFPVLITVELNSQGDPLLYPQIEQVLELIRDYKCELKVQTNGTLFTDRVIDLLLNMYGEVNISLDAVGAKFDEVRKGGVWTKAEPGIRKLLSQRDPEALAIGLYPTITKRTVGEALSIVQWAAEIGIDSVTFHRYSPLPTGWSFEEAPMQEEYDKACAEVREWCVQNGSPLNVWFESERLNPDAVPSRKIKIASPEKQAFKNFYNAPSYPLDLHQSGADPQFVCAAPNSYVEVGLDGQLSVCCRSQEVALGYGTSVEDFADTWFGRNYAMVRDSMRRDYEGSYPLPNCEGCIKFFAPKSVCGRAAVVYEGQSTVRDDGLLLALTGDVVLDQITEYRDKVFTAICVPPGLDIADFEMVEGEIILRRAESIDDVEHGEPGAFFMTGRAIFMTSTDGKDPRFARRVYALRPKV